MLSSVVNTTYNDRYRGDIDNLLSTMARSARRGPWLPEEDQALLQLVRTQGANNWVRISQQIQHRSPKQCRERYHQNLKPSLKHDPITAQEGEMIERLVQDMGKRWAEIARRLGNRSDNAVKNWWNGSVNRRRRNPAQPTTGFKQVGTRLQPVPFTRPLEHNYSSQHSQPSHDSSGYDTSASHATSRSSLRPHRPADLQIPSPVESHNHSVASTSPRLALDPRTTSGLSSASLPTPSSALGGPPLSRTTTSDLRPELPPLRHASFSLQHGSRRNSAFERPPISPALSDTSQRHAPSLVSDSQSMYSISPKTVTTPRSGIPAPIEIGGMAWPDASASVSAATTAPSKHSFPNSSFSGHEQLYLNSNTYPKHVSVDPALHRLQQSNQYPHQHSNSHFRSSSNDDRSKDSRMNVSRLLE